MKATVAWNRSGSHGQEQIELRYLERSKEHGVAGDMGMPSSIARLYVCANAWHPRGATNREERLDSGKGGQDNAGHNEKSE